MIWVFIMRHTFSLSQCLGVPRPNGKKHAEEIGTMALDLMHHIEKLRIPHMPGRKFQLRVGCHSGEYVTFDERLKPKQPRFGFGRGQFALMRTHDGEVPELPSERRRAK